MQLSGLLKTFPPAELLQWAHNDHLTGTLVVRRTTREKRILLRNGSIVGCLSNERFDFYGQFLLACGTVSERELLSALSACDESDGKLRLGEALVKLGILDRETVVRTLREQTEQSIIDVFLWPRGVFFLLEDEPEPAPIEMRPIEAISLVLEGVRQIDEVGRLRERLPHDSVVLRTGPAWPGEDLRPLGRRAVSVFQPNQTLLEFHEATGGGYCQFLTEIDSLCQDGIFEIDRLGEPAQDTMTLSLLDIMLDRIQDERQATIGATVEMPIAVLGQMYAFWLDQDQGPDLTDQPPHLQHLAQAMDGTRRLGSLLTAEPESRDEQLEWLWLRIGSRRIVLLPRPLDEALRKALVRNGSGD